MSRYDDVISDFCSVLPQTAAAHADLRVRVYGLAGVWYNYLVCMSTALPARCLPPIQTNILVRIWVAARMPQQLLWTYTPHNSSFNAVNYIIRQFEKKTRAENHSNL